MPHPNPRKHIEVQGVVQGVGFRPFVYRIAQLAGVHGYVLNSSQGVEIEAEGTDSSIERFLRALQQDLPPLARIGGNCHLLRWSHAVTELSSSARA
jgi:hydrogenase maturation protein HypF